ncbi:MAG: efflux RND transporter periplasmic adaptor subunit [Planctomycetes bacterium]|nr:efflux RND transporter periplasmic adaptor subunit [Planctomycetota bacterium]
MSVQHLDLTTLARSSPEQARGSSRPSEAVVAPPARRWKTRLLLPALVFCSAAGLLAYTGREMLVPATDVRVVPVVVASGGSAVQAGGIAAQAPGWVEADPFPIGVSALAEGVVSEVLALEGQTIRAGEVVARLVDDEAKIAVNRAEAELAESRAALASAEAALLAAQQSWDFPVALQQAVDVSRAKRAEKQAELDRWPSELKAQEAVADEMKAEFERAKDLHAKGQTAEIELIRAQKRYESAVAEADSIRQKKPVIEAELASMVAELTAAEENLRLRIADTRDLAEAKAARQRESAGVARTEAMLADARLRLERMEVRSPASGAVMTRLVEPGSRIMMLSDMPRANQVLRLYDPQKLQVRVDVPLNDAAKVGIGMQAEIIVQILPERVYHGHVTRIVHEADIQRNTLQVKVRIDDPSPELKPEMLARARFIGEASTTSAPDTSATRVFAPLAYLHRTEQGTAHAMVVNQGRSAAEMRMVVLGHVRNGDYIEVVDGLRPGDRIIADDPMRLHDGQHIRIVAAGGH